MTPTLIPLEDLARELDHGTTLADIRALCVTHPGRYIRQVYPPEAELSPAEAAEQEVARLEYEAQRETALQHALHALCRRGHHKALVAFYREYAAAGAV